MSGDLALDLAAERSENAELREKLRRAAIDIDEWHRAFQKQIGLTKPGCPNEMGLHETDRWWDAFNAAAASSPELTVAICADFADKAIEIGRKRGRLP